MPQTTGTRVDSIDAVWDGPPGAYFVNAARSVVWVKLPNGVDVRIPVQEGVAGEGEHEPLWGLTVHPDGTITLTPSIQLHAAVDGMHDGWHGFLERGTFREV